MGKLIDNPLKKLNKLRKAGAQSGKGAIKAMQKQGKIEQRVMFNRFEKEKYADKTLRVVPLRAFSAAWGRRKRRVKADKRRGHFGRGVSKTVRSPKAFLKLKRGFRIDLLAPDLTTLVRFVNKRNKRIRVRTYIKHYIKAKAPGLGNFSVRQMQRVKKAAFSELSKNLKRVAGLKQVGNKLELQMKLGKLKLS